MGLVVSMLAITVGAVMRFAVTATTTGYSVHTVGVILMVVGALGAVMSIVFWASWGGFGRFGRPTVITTTQPTETVVVERRV
jgi:hypothetical protein